MCVVAATTFERDGVLSSPLCFPRYDKEREVIFGHASTEMEDPRCPSCEGLHGEGAEAGNANDDISLWRHFLTPAAEVNTLLEDVPRASFECSGAAGCICDSGRPLIAFASISGLGTPPVLSSCILNICS